MEDSDGMSGLDEDEEGEDDDEDANQWPCSTVLHIEDAVDPKLLAYFHKYLDKPGNDKRIFQPSMTTLDDEDEDDDGDEEDDDDLDIDGEEVVDETFRKCQVARDTQTLQKLYNMLEEPVDAAVDQFLEKYTHFSLVSTKEDYNLLKFEEGDFYAEHVECTGLNDDSDGSSRRLCVYVVVEPSYAGGDFEFIYQGCKISPSAGSIIVFPSCPLHPMRISRVTEGRLLTVCNYLL